MDKTLKLFEFNLDHNQLQKASIQEGTLFLQGLRISNELSTLEKAILASIQAMKGRDKTSLEASAQVAQTFIFIRLLAGLVYEAFLLIRKGFHAETEPLKRRWWNFCKAGESKEKRLFEKYAFRDLAPEYFKLMPEESKILLEGVKEYFANTNNPIVQIRNRLGFHYDLKIALENYGLFSVIDDPHILLEEGIGNSLHVCANQLVVLQLTKIMQGNPNDLKSVKTKWETVLEDVRTNSKRINSFLNQYVLAFARKYCDLDSKKLKEYTLDNVAFLDDIVLPYFLKQTYEKQEAVVT